jgi:hypothetical protein
MAVPQIDRFSRDDLNYLGQQFCTEINAVDTGRSQILDDYELWIDNYEGEVEPPESEKPWTGASDAHIPVTSTDTDILWARFMNAIFGQFPKFMIRPKAGHWTEFARDTQKFSEWLEDEEIPLYGIFKKLLLVTIKFGSCVVYIPWETRPEKQHIIDENGNFTPVEADIAGKPTLKVIHPKDFLLPIHARDAQTSPWAGYRYKLRASTLELWKKRKFFREDVSDELLETFATAADGSKANITIPIGEQRYDRVQETAERAVGLTRAKISDELDMVHIYARMDIDGDGLEENFNFHMHEKSGKIARIAFDHHRNGRRPFAEYHFFPREGVWYSIGIPEMLENIQRNMDVTFRQIQDNNTVKNTQSFKAKRGGAIKPDEDFHPAKIYFPAQMEDFDVLPMNTGTFNSSIQDMQTMQGWGERRTGIADPIQQPGDRQPATSFIAARQEQAQRIDTVIGGLRESLGETWMQVLELYAQFKPIVEYEIREGEEFEMLQWNSMGPDKFRKRINIKPTASTAALNKSVLRTEMITLLEQSIAFNQSQGQMVDMYLQAQDPTLRMYIEKSITGQHKIMQRILDTYEMAKDEENVLPNPEEYLPNVNIFQPPIGGGNVPNEAALGAPQDLGAGGGGGFAPPTAPNRPTPGQGIERPPAPTGGGG